MKLTNEYPIPVSREYLESEMTEDYRWKPWAIFIIVVLSGLSVFIGVICFFIQIFN